jgi:arsenate reductase
MKKVYYLSTCDTCTRIIKEVGVNDSFIKQDIKYNPIEEKQLNELLTKVDSIEELLNKRAIKYSELGLKEKNLNDRDIKNYILTEYTFLKRPVFIIDSEIFIGNSKKTVEQLKQKLGV